MPIALTLFAQAEAADALRCDGGPVVVTAADPGHAAQTCEAIHRILPILAACGVTPTNPPTVTVTDTIENALNCVGLYHCETNQIEVLSPDALETLRHANSAFRALPTAVYYESILAHEIAHAAHNAVSCPFANCLVTSEYVAYAMQVLSLPPPYRAAFETSIEMNAKVSRYDISEMSLRMAPDKFARNVWAHYSQRDNGCAYVQDMMEGEFYLDTERP